MSKCASGVATLAFYLFIYFFIIIIIIFLHSFEKRVNFFKERIAPLEEILHDRSKILAHGQQKHPIYQFQPASKLRHIAKCFMHIHVY